jgi:hypothetical protein
MIEPYNAVGLIPSFWGIRRREEIKHNIEHLKGLTKRHSGFPISIFRSVCLRFLKAR